MPKLEFRGVTRAEVLQALQMKVIFRKEPLNATPAEYDLLKDELARPQFGGRVTRRVLEIDFSKERPWDDLAAQLPAELRAGLERFQARGFGRRYAIFEILKNANEPIALFIKNPEMAREGHELSALRGLINENMGDRKADICFVTCIRDMASLPDRGAVVSPFYNIFGSSRVGYDETNPYQRGPAVAGRFFGRNGELETIMGDGKIAIALCGHYKTGKTSILLEAKERLEIQPNVGVVFIDVEQYQRLNEILRAVCTALKISPKNPVESIREYDRRLVGEGKRLFVLMDEFTQIIKFRAGERAHTLSVFHALTGGLDAIRFVYALHPPAIQTISSETSRFLPSLITMHIGPLDPCDIDQMIDQAANARKPVTLGARRRIHELSGDYAFLTEELLRLGFERGTFLGIDEGVVQNVLSNGGMIEVTDTIGQIWKRLTPIERDLLRTALLHHGATRTDLLSAPFEETRNPEPATVLTAIDFLTSKSGMLYLVDSHYCVRGKLVEDRLRDIVTVERSLH